MKLRVGDGAPDVALQALDGTRLDCGRPEGPVVVSFPGRRARWRPVLRRVAARDPDR